MITPISFPDIDMSAGPFDPIDDKQIARMMGRRTETNYTGPHSWRGSWTSIPIDGVDFSTMERFVRRRGTILGYDHKTPRPQAYAGAPLSGTKAAGGAFNGDAAIQSITDLVTVVVEGLPADFVLSVWDAIGFKVSDTEMSLHRLDEAVAANASGVATVKLAQPLPDTFTTSATVHLEKPTCIMQIIEADVPKVPGPVQISFSAVEVF